MRIFGFLIVFSLIIVACAPAPAETPMLEEQMDEKVAEMPVDAMDDTHPEQIGSDEAAGGISADEMKEASPGEMTDKSGDEMMDTPEENVADESAGEIALSEAPDWFKASLTDLHSGDPFTIDALAGKVILVETLAQWCSNCLRQQQQVLELHNQLGQRDDFISLGLDIDPNENAETLKAYVERNGFTWTYAVSPPEVSREISRLYGDQFLNPPSTPMLIIDRQGEVHLMPFGIKSAADLMSALEPFLKSET
jgi:hypothetical protein